MLCSSKAHYSATGFTPSFPLSLFHSRDELARHDVESKEKIELGLWTFNLLQQSSTRTVEKLQTGPSCSHGTQATLSCWSHAFAALAPGESEAMATIGLGGTDAL